MCLEDLARSSEMRFLGSGVGEGERWLSLKREDNLGLFAYKSSMIQD
jgi:hypothetical protein